jgi:hypothetical protein
MQGDAPPTTAAALAGIQEGAEAASCPPPTAAAAPADTSAPAAPSAPAAKRARTEASEGGAAGSETSSQSEGAGGAAESGSSGETQTASLSREVERLKLLLAEREAAHKKEVKAVTERLQREVRYRDEALARMMLGAGGQLDQSQQMQLQGQAQAGSGGKKGKNATPTLPPHLMHPSFGTPPAMQYPLVSYQTTAAGQPAQPPAPSLSGGPSYGGARLAHTVTEDEARFLQETPNP